jgi:hypothetical protein
MTVQVERPPQTLNSEYAKTHYENNEMDMTKKAAVLQRRFKEVKMESLPNISS